MLGADAARALGVDRADGSVRLWLGNQWFSVVGILDRLPLAPEVDRTALIARADASAAFEILFLELGAVALLVGGIGIANVMVIAVLERRGEIGLRRALGASRSHVGVQFVAEAALIAGAVAGALLGGFATTAYAAARHWSAVVPVPVLLAAAGIAVGVGAVAGLYPALPGWRRPRPCG